MADKVELISPSPKVLGLRSCCHFENKCFILELSNFILELSNLINTDKILRDEEKCSLSFERTYQCLQVK